MGSFRPARSLSRLIICAATCLPTASHAAGAASRTPTLEDLKAANKEMVQFYGDVGSRLVCGKPRSKAEKIICGDPYLLAAALLNARSQVYAYENATKTEVDHKTFKAKFPLRCESRTCIVSFFSDQINGAQGSESPFDVNWLGLK